MGIATLLLFKYVQIRLIWSRFSFAPHKQLVPQESRGCQDARTEASTIRDANALLQPKPLRG